MTALASPPSHHRITRQLRLKEQWWLLFAAFIAGGVFEVSDNILGLRQFNFESSAPAFVKLAKEAAILWLVLGLVRRNSLPRLTLFGLVILTMVVLCVLSILQEPPATPSAQAGMIYYLVSLGMLLTTCSLISPSDSNDFARHFVLPVIVAVLLTQGLEIVLAPDSLYKESNLFGLDRRAGIAVIPTTAGMLGVVGFSTLRGIPRLLSLAVIGLASSSINKIGSLVTAKSVALNQIDSVIVDSMYLEALTPLQNHSRHLAADSNVHEHLWLCQKHRDDYVRLGWHRSSGPGSMDRLAHSSLRIPACWRRFVRITLRRPEPLLLT